MYTKSVRNPAWVLPSLFIFYLILLSGGLISSPAIIQLLSSKWSYDFYMGVYSIGAISIWIPILLFLYLASFIFEYATISRMVALFVLIVGMFYLFSGAVFIVAEQIYLVAFLLLVLLSGVMVFVITPYNLKKSLNP